MKIENKEGKIDILIETNEEVRMLLKYLLVKEFAGKLKSNYLDILYTPIEKDIRLILLDIESQLIKENLVKSNF